MKKVLVVVVLVLLAVPAFAANNEVAKGNFSVALPLFSFTKGMGDLESSKFSFLAMGYEPEVQYFVMDGLSVGGKVGYQNNKVAGVSEKTTSFGPLANYYLTMIKAPVLPYAGAGLSYEKTGDVKTTTFKVQGGVVYMLGKYLAGYGEVFLGYSQVKVEESVSGPVLGLAAGVKAFF